MYPVLIDNNNRVACMWEVCSLMTDKHFLVCVGVYMIYNQSIYTYTIRSILYVDHMYIIKSREVVYIVNYSMISTAQYTINIIKNLLRSFYGIS